MNSLVYIDLPIVLVPVYFLGNIFSPSFTIRFPTCTIIIRAYFSLGVLRHVTAILTVVLIKTEHNTGTQGLLIALSYLTVPRILCFVLDIINVNDRL